MKKIKAASLIAASVIAVSSFGTLTAGAVTFTEDETTGAKTWTFVVTDSDYPDGVTTNEDGDKVFGNSGTFYVSNGYSATQSETRDYLTLSVNNTSGTVESKANDALHLNQNRNDTSSTLSWTAPEDGTISVTGVNILNLYVNSDLVGTCISYEGKPTVTYNVKQNDQIQVDADRWGGITEFTFTPVQTRTAMYSFEQTANDLNGKTLYIDSTAGQRTKELTGTHFTGDGNVRLGVIITNIPSDVEITSVTIQ